MGESKEASSSSFCPTVCLPPPPPEARNRHTRREAAKLLIQLLIVCDARLERACLRSSSRAPRQKRISSRLERRARARCKPFSNRRARLSRPSRRRRKTTLMPLSASPALSPTVCVCLSFRRLAASRNNISPLWGHVNRRALIVRRRARSTARWLARGAHRARRRRPAARPCAASGACELRPADTAAPTAAGRGLRAAAHTSTKAARGRTKAPLGMERQKVDKKRRRRRRRAELAHVNYRTQKRPARAGGAADAEVASSSG